MDWLFPSNIRTNGEHVGFLFLHNKNLIDFLDPYRWADLPMAQKPFSDAIIKQVLPLIDNTDFVRDLGNDLRKIFQVLKTSLKFINKFIKFKDG